VLRGAPDGIRAAAALTSPALRALITNNDLLSVANLTTVLAPAGPLTTNGTQHYGPYPSTSPDSGTCGNDWAQDTFDGHFTVRPNGDGTYTVVEEFKNGSFVTNAGASPGACETNPRRDDRGRQDRNDARLLHHPERRHADLE
jgi:hypothetical protein